MKLATQFQSPCNRNRMDPSEAPAGSVSENASPGISRNKQHQRPPRCAQAGQRTNLDHITVCPNNLGGT